MGIKDYGDNENKNLADRYGVKTDAFPSVKLFIDGDINNPIDFKIGEHLKFIANVQSKILMMSTGSDETFTTTQLFAFLKEHSKVHILAPGCDEKLDKLSEKFMKEEQKRSEILKEALEIVQKISCEEVGIPD